MSAPSAPTQPAVGVDHEVTDFAGGSGRADQRNTVMHDRAADAGADKNADEIVAIGAGTEPGFALGGNLDIVPEGNRHPEPFAQSRADRQVDC